MVFKPQRVKSQNVEIKCMLTIILKMGVDNFLYICYVYMENYMHAYILPVMNMKKTSSYSRPKEWFFLQKDCGVWAVRD